MPIRTIPRRMTRDDGSHTWALYRVMLRVMTTCGVKARMWQSAEMNLVYCLQTLQPGSSSSPRRTM